MLITRECDYGIRIIRALSSKMKITVTQICEMEDIPLQFAYKILKKLSHANIVQSIRGALGGYMIKADLEKLTIYDIIIAIDGELVINECMKDGYLCKNHRPEQYCKIHNEVERIQNLIISELKRKPFAELLK